jgi:hypothetical protein
MMFKIAKFYREATSPTKNELNFIRTFQFILHLS